MMYCGLVHIRLMYNLNMLCLQNNIHIFFINLHSTVVQHLILVYD